MVHYLTYTDIGETPWSHTWPLVAAGSTGVPYMTTNDSREPLWFTTWPQLTVESLHDSLRSSDSGEPPWSTTWQLVTVGSHRGPLSNISWEWEANMVNNLTSSDIRAYPRFLDKTNLTRILTPRARYTQYPSAIPTRSRPWTLPVSTVVQALVPIYPLGFDKTNFPRVPPPPRWAKRTIILTTRTRSRT